MRARREGRGERKEERGETGNMKRNKAAQMMPMKQSIVYMCFTCLCIITFLLIVVTIPSSSPAVSPHNPKMTTNTPNKMQIRNHLFDNNPEDLIASMLQTAFRKGAEGSGCTVDEDFINLDAIKDLRIFFAADLHNNDAVLAHWVAEFLKMVLHLPRENIFVSIFDSASKDTTPAWVHLMRNILTLQQVPHQVISDAGDARRQGQHRIDFMAYVRNQALQPLGVHRRYRHNLKTYMGANYTFVPVIEEDSFQVGSGAGANMTFDRIVFLNDVFFCMRDVLRLLQHNVDLACGLDYDLNINNKARLSGTPQFYDTWVGRDMEGKRMRKQPPHFANRQDQTKLRKGEPIQVQCCWNGIAVLNAAPFHRGMRFRHVLGEDECKSSECSHLCDDLWVNGYSRMIVDPRVKLAYKFHEWRSAVQHAEPRGLTVDLSASSVDVGTLNSRPPKSMMCCSMVHNNTDRALECSKSTDSHNILKYSPCLCEEGKYCHCL